MDLKRGRRPPDGPHGITGLGALGARGYRAAQPEGGIVAERIYLGAYANRYGTTGLSFYDDEATRFFSLDAEARAACWSSPWATARARVTRESSAGSRVAAKYGYIRRR